MAPKGTQAYPLAWPKSTPRTKNRSQSRFGDKTIAISIKSLKVELARLMAQYIVISTNVPLKPNGDPYSDPGKMPEPGVAVYFQLNGKPYCLPCDRWGVGSIEQTFAGFKELAAASVEPPWWEVLECLSTANTEVIAATYRKLAMKYHPDAPGGSHEAMTQLNTARDRALAEIAGKYE